MVLSYIVSYLIVPVLGGNGDLWWQLSTVITCGTLAGAIIPEFVKVFTSTESRHVKEVVVSSEQGGASLNILSGFVAGNFSAYWLGMAMLVLMGAAYLVSNGGVGTLMMAPAVFAFGLVAFGFLIDRMALWLRYELRQDESISLVLGTAAIGLGAARTLAESSGCIRASKDRSGRAMNSSAV